MESIARRLRLVNPDPSSNAQSPGQGSPGRKPPSRRGSGQRTRQRNARREARRKHRNECRKRFLQSEPSLPGINFDGWRGVKLLGQGGQGHAGLWICVDDHGKIVNRMVIKETVEREAKFNDPQIWHNGVLHATPKEAVMNDLVTAMPDDNSVPGTASNIVTIFGSSVQTDRGTYRIYQEFCAHGDLWGLVSAQKGSRRHIYRDERGETVHYSPGFSKVPEPAVWHLFLSLTNACIYMNDIRAYKFADWYPNEDMPEGANIVHLDIKPANIFLAEPWDEWFPKYPSVRVGDFGSAILTHNDDAGNPEDYLNQPVTQGFIPPELLGHDTHGMRREGLGPWTNVHQIAMTVYAVMTGTHPSQVDYSAGGRYPPMEGLYSFYSGALIALLVLCLRPLPADRPTPQDLNKRLLEDGAPHFRGMEDDRAFGLVSMSDWLHLDMQDEYGMGFAFRPPSPEASTPHPPGLTGPVNLGRVPGAPGSEPSRGRRRGRQPHPRDPNRGSGPFVHPGVQQGSELFFTAAAPHSGPGLPAGLAPASAFTIGSDNLGRSESGGPPAVPSDPLSSFPPFGRGETVDPGAVPSEPLSSFPPFGRGETVHPGVVPSDPLSSFPPFGRGETVDPGAVPSEPLSSFPPFGRGETDDPGAVPSVPISNFPPFSFTPAVRPPSPESRRRPVRGLDNFDRPYIPSVREWVSGIFSRDAPSRVPPRNPAPASSHAAGDSGAAPAGSIDDASTRESFSGLGIFSRDAPRQVPRPGRTPVAGAAGAGAAAARPANAASGAAETGDSGGLSGFGWMADMF